MGEENLWVVGVGSSLRYAVPLGPVAQISNSIKVGVSWHIIPPTPQRICLETGEMLDLQVVLDWIFAHSLWSRNGDWKG